MDQYSNENIQDENQSLSVILIIRSIRLELNIKVWAITHRNIIGQRSSVLHSSISSMTIAHKPGDHFSVILGIIDFRRLPFRILVVWHKRGLRNTVVLSGRYKIISVANFLKADREKN